MSEAAIQAQILNQIGSRPDVRLFRINVIAARQGQRFIRSAPPGHPDLAGILAPSGRAIYIEIKSATGRLSKQQARFRDMARAMGALYILARSVEDVSRALDQD